MKVQVRNKKYVYLKKSVRIDGKVKTFSHYVGPSTAPDLERDIEFNKKKLEGRIERYKAIHAPLENLLTKEQIKRLEEVKKEHLKKPPIPADYESFGIKFTYNTNAIEGSTVTERDAVLILKDGVAPRGRTLIEIREAENHKKAFEYILNENCKVTKAFILKIHKIASKGLLGTYEGKFRDVPVQIVGTDVKTTPPEDIDTEVNGLLRWYGKARKKMNPVQAAAVFHEKFEKIHPFRDYNGRTGRLILNYMLKSEGYPMIIIPVKKRERYYKVLDASHKGNYKPTVKFIYDLIKDFR